VTAELDFLDHLARESARFAEAISAAPAGAPVSCCPDWNADDLLWHLGEVQWFWGTIVRERVTADQAEALKPPRPTSTAGCGTAPNTRPSPRPATPRS
jgi:Mycothiol maleylpyruvate isomerase N-terminal domain